MSERSESRVRERSAARRSASESQSPLSHGTGKGGNNRAGKKTSLLIHKIAKKQIASRKYFFYKKKSLCGPV